MRFSTLLAVVALAGCGGIADKPAPSSDDGGTSGSTEGGSSSGGADAGISSIDAVADTGASRAPQQHRPTDAQCSAPVAPGDCNGPFPGDAGCASDSVCTAGTSGRCINRGGGPAAPCYCTYDECAHDTDCPTGQLCACHDSPYTDSHDNTCMPGNCRIDTDCGPGGYCSPSATPADCGDGLAGYYCHTPMDACIDDSDCPPSSTNPGIPGCTYSLADARWECVQRPVCL